MPTVSTKDDLRTLVLRHADRLSRKQRAIADYLVENSLIAPFLSIPELARRSKVSEATVVRFAQRLGYTGFAELKADLVGILTDRLGAGVPSSPPTGDELLEQVATVEIENIRRTADGIDPHTFQQVAEALARADTVLTFGLGISAHLASLAGYILAQVGLRTITMSTAMTSPREQLVSLRPRDLVLAFSFPPYSRQTIDVLSEASDRGAATVAITDRLTGPAATVARHVLPVSSENMMFTNAVSAITVLLNALATQIATADRAGAVDAISEINRILSEDDNVLSSDR